MWICWGEGIEKRSLVWNIPDIWQTAGAEWGIYWEGLGNRGLDRREYSKALYTTARIWAFCHRKMRSIWKTEYRGDLSWHDVNMILFCWKRLKKINSRKPGKLQVWGLFDRIWQFWQCVEECIASIIPDGSELSQL